MKLACANVDFVKIQWLLSLPLITNVDITDKVTLAQHLHTHLLYSNTAVPTVFKSLIIICWDLKKIKNIQKVD